MTNAIHRRDLLLGFAIALPSLLTGCTSERIIYRPLTVPASLTQVVQKPLKPNPKTATQQDVAVFIVEQNAAIDLCNTQLTIIRDWSHHWTSSTKQNTPNNGSAIKVSKP